MTSSQVMYQRLLELEEVKQAFAAHEKALLTRDSVSRKLCGGSTAVNVNDLKTWEAELRDAKKNLDSLAERFPLLVQHPLLSAEQ